MKFLLLLSFSIYAFAQQPVIQPEIKAVLNAATNEQSYLAPQTLISIYGEKLASGTEQASAFPLPREMQGARVTINGVAAPLLYVSPKQINAQIPSTSGSSEYINVLVWNNNVNSSQFSVKRANRSLGVFTNPATGCGQGAILNIHADGSMTPNGASNSYDPLHDLGLAIFSTGMGLFPNRADGKPYEYDPSVNLKDRFSVNVGVYPGLNHPSKAFGVAYAGPAPGYAGLEQINVLHTNGPAAFVVPPPQGCRVPLLLTGYEVVDSTNQALRADSTAQQVTVSIHDGGGACVDPPSRSLGLLTWLNDRGTRSFDAQFLEAPEIDFPLPPIAGVQTDWGYYNPTPWPPPPTCAAAFAHTLDAGQISITAPGFQPIVLEKSVGHGMIHYPTFITGSGFRLPPQTGFTVRASGLFSGERAFETKADIPTGIIVTNDLARGKTIKIPFTLNWTGGDARSLVTIELVASVPGQPDKLLRATTLASAGTRTLELPPRQAAFTFPVGTAVKVIVTQVPSESRPVPFSAPGLTLGGAHTWRYVSEFADLVSEPR